MKILSNDLESKIYFSAGDIVELRLNIPNKPLMVVVKKVSSIFKHDIDKKSILKGIMCIWFTKDGMLLEHVFNTKDLLFVKNG